MRTIRPILLAAFLLAPFAAKAQNSTLQPFTLSGNVSIQGKGEAQRRMPQSLTMGVRHTTPTGTQIGAALTSMPVDQTRREIGYTGQVARDDNGDLLGYRMTESQTSNFGFIVKHSNGRHFQELSSRWDVMAPATGDKTHDIALMNLCSLTVHVQGLVAGERFDNLFINAESVGSGDRIRAYTDWLAKDEGTSDPKSAAGYISTIASDKETATVELLVQEGFKYDVDGRIYFKDTPNEVVNTSLNTISIDAGNCTNAEATVTVKSPQEKIKGSYLLKPDPDSPNDPKVEQYRVTFRSTSLDTDKYYSIPNIFLTPPAGEPANFELRAGVVRLETRGGTPNSVGSRFDLKWSDGRTGSLYPPETTDFWSPEFDEATKKGVYPDGTVIITEDEVEEIHFESDMAFLRGDLLINGCAVLDDVSSGTVQMSGQTLTTGQFTDETGRTSIGKRGAAGGLSVSPLVLPSGEFELVGVPAPWSLNRFTLQLARPGAGSDNEGYLSSELQYSPKTSPITLVPKRADAQKTTQNIPLGAVTVTLETKNEDGSLRPFHTPVLKISGHAERDADANLLSSSNIQSKGLTTLKTTHKVTILAPPGVSTINATGQIPANPDGSGTTNISSFPSLENVPFRAPRQGGACAATCAVRENGAWHYYNDDETDPTISVTFTPQLNASNQTRLAVLTVSGDVEDESPVDVRVYLKGVAGSNFETTVTGEPEEQRFTSTVALPMGLSTIVIEVEDRCGGASVHEYDVERLVNNPPKIDMPADMTEDVGTEVTFTVTATDEDGDDLTITCTGPGTFVQNPGHNPTTGQYTLPAGTPVGSHEVKCTASDGGLADTGSVTVTIVQPNRPPVITVPGPQTEDVGTEVTFTVTATDPDGDDLTFSTSGPGTIDPTTGVYTLPDDAVPGVYTVTFTVTDGEYTDSKDVVVTIVQPNRPPVITVPGPQTEDVGTEVTFTVTATDPDGDDLTFSTSGPGTIDPTTGVYTLPDDAVPGVYTVTFTVTDGEYTDSKDVIVTIVQPNRPPVITVPDAQTVPEGTDVTFTVSATDEDGDDLTITCTGPGTFAQSPGHNPTTGEYTLPADTPAGSYEVKCTASDGELEDTKTVTVVVKEKDDEPPVDTNRPPVFEPVGPIETDGPDGFQVVVTDPDGDDLTCEAEKLPPGATFNTETLLVEWDGITPSGEYLAVISCSDGELSSTLEVKIRARVFDRVGGGWGGCSSTSGTGLLASLALLAFAVRRRRFA